MTSFFCAQVAADSGALPLGKVFELVLEGENLPVRMEKELKVTQLVLILVGCLGLLLTFCALVSDPPEKQLCLLVQLLKTRSMLYCICRKPYDQRAMIACDQCDEWYHFDCLKLRSAPEVYICPACEPRAQETEVVSTASGVDHERSVWSL